MCLPYLHEEFPEDQECPWKTVPVRDHHLLWQGKEEDQAEVKVHSSHHGREACWEVCCHIPVRWSSSRDQGSQGSEIPWYSQEDSREYADILMLMAINRVIRPEAMDLIQEWHDDSYISTIYVADMSSAALPRAMAALGKMNSNHAFLNEILRSWGYQAHCTMILHHTHPSPGILISLNTDIPGSILIIHRLMCHLWNHRIQASQYSMTSIPDLLMT